MAYLTMCFYKAFLQQTDPYIFPFEKANMHIKSKYKLFICQYHFGVIHYSVHLHCKQHQF